ncbi:MAG: hypothetical protein WC371_01095 [Parachlamydiales bacterium]|jgi:hypothetical protein
MRFISGLMFVFFSALALFWFWINYPVARNWMIDLFKTKKYTTLEVRFSAEALMEKHKKELLKDSAHTFLEPSLMFHPYLLMEVKYSRSSDKTSEGLVLWSMCDGEMVTNVSSWETTHGFIDCIRAGADRYDFKVINTLAASGGSMDRETLLKRLNVETDKLDDWLEACKRKSLVVQNGNFYRLHFQNPRFYVVPETRFEQHLATKEFRSISRVRNTYRSSQIEGLAKAAFGIDFTIRKTTLVYLPVYTITVQNPDGSQTITYWNALNGKRLPETYNMD